MLETKHIREHLRDEMLGACRRRLEHLRLEHRRREGRPIQLPTRTQRNFVEHHHRRRHHVARQCPTHELEQSRGIDHLIDHRKHIGNQRSRARRQVPADRDREIHTRMRHHRRIDLTELDPETTHLHLKVRAPHILEIQSRGPPHHITRAIQPGTRLTEGIRDKSLSSQSWTPAIATSQRVTGKIQLTSHTLRHRIQPRIQHKRRHSANRASNRHRPGRNQRITDVRGHSRLGRTIRVEQETAGCPPGHQLRRARLTADYHHLEFVQTCRIH
ncbi:hypothetical protein MLGJGCBP_03963 [Rhodococcus sp. T7]|nr:hypothetical protein MLGJGCBP_03963 [Rhodococcus sp. T7]